ncbi:tetratricopeptide repeat-containing sensor histidine kinase [Flavobacterium sp. 5]|uniref:tetratricopeptide repeat-containing sensor histidine kinase n=1 Tax=Flavobacterium sp. 5 TaxID=2035199 RepID=UPI000C2B6FD9|nr:tetratricopeptide repeat-containing sensor histidine kinase [Flavobacterium sp. 5]PKB17163.1 tetratricopeptide repeat protein [Flavobacterium sp. 5]
MPQLLKNFIYIHFLGLCCVLNAQKIDPKQNPIPKISAFELQEKKSIDGAFILFNKGEDKKAYKITHQLLKNHKSKLNLVNINLLLAYYFNKRSLIDSSLYYTNQVLKSNTNSNDSLRYRTYSLSYNLLAINNKKRGLLEESKKWHIKGIETSQKFNETDLYYTHVHGLALTYSDLGDYKNALKLFKQCLEYKQGEEIILGSYINIGDIYSSLKEYDKSNSYFNKAKVLCEKTNNIQGKSVIAIGLASNYQSQKKLNDATLLYQEAIKLADKGELPQIAITARLNLGKIFLDLKKQEDAKIIFSSALNDAEKLGYLHEQNEIYDNLKDIFITQNDYKNAYLFTNKSSKIKDSIAHLQKDKEINELEVKYKTWQNEKEIKVLQVENKAKILELKNNEEALAFLNLQKEINQKKNENKILNLNNISQKKASEITSLKKDQLLKTAEINWQKETKKITLIAFSILLIPIIALLFLYYQRLKTQRLLNQNEKEISEQKIITLVKDQELKLIKAAVKGQDKARSKIAKELHDSIGGNLAAIKLQLNTVASKPDAIQIIQKQLDETYQQVRDLSHNLIPEKFSQNNFCNLLEEYQKNLAGINDLKTSFVAYPRTQIDLIAESLQMEIYKIIQELVTNTLKHAKATTIELQLNCIENNLNILFEDNGIGFDSYKKSHGIGFKNINSRLNTISGSMQIDSMLRRGTIINIEIPLTKSPFKS